MITRFSPRKFFPVLVLSSSLLGFCGCSPAVPDPLAPSAPPAPTEVAPPPAVNAPDRSLVQDVDAFVQPGLAPQPLADRVRIGTYNIQNFTDGENDGYGRTAAIVERQVQGAARALHEVQADLMVIEEIENSVILQRLNEALPEPYPLGYVTRFDEGGRNDKLNIALLSRLPVREAKELDFSAIPRTRYGHPPRGVLRFQVDLGADRRLLGYGVHLKSNHGDRPENVAKRQAAIRLILEDAAALAEAEPGVAWEVVVAGDMNTDPENEAFSDDPSLTAFGDWLDLWRGRPIAERVTIPKRVGDPAFEYPDAAFDRVVVSPELGKAPWKATGLESVKKFVRIDNSYIRAGQEDGHVSDHYPVYLDLLP